MTLLTQTRPDKPIIATPRDRAAVRVLRGSPASRRTVRLRGAAMLTFAAAALICGSRRSARAQFIMTLPSDPLVIIAKTGGTATFTATLTNNNPFDLYLNSDTFTLFGPATLDDTLFQNAFVTPPGGIQPTLAANGGTLTLPLFTVSLPANLIPGSIYSGTITLQGGADPLQGDDLDTEQFAVRAAITPEPGSVALVVGLGVTGAGIFLRRARRK